MPFPGLVVGLITPEYLASDPGLKRLEDCDILEFRGDLFPRGGKEAYPEFMEKVLEARAQGLRIIHTLRLAQDGGQWPTDKAMERLPLWDALASLPAVLKPDLLDIEIEGFAGKAMNWIERYAKSGMGVLPSHHRFDGAYSPAEYVLLRQRLALPGAAGIKVAVTCDSEPACLDLMRFAAETARQFSLSGVFSMGLSGKLTRLVSPLLGCPLTYGYMAGGPAAPGQWSVKALRQGLSDLAGQCRAGDYPEDIWRKVEAWCKGA